MIQSYSNEGQQEQIKGIIVQIETQELLVISTEWKNSILRYKESVKCTSRG
jgi:hypothetical protein